MIDFKQELKNYTPIDLDKLLKTNPNMPDNLKNSILLYNKALDNFRTKSEDIAIIELKKAISLNPDSCESINLLGVLYAGTGDYTKAREIFEKVISKDRNNLKALEYIKALDPNYNQSGNVKGNQKDKKESKKVACANEKNTGELSYATTNYISNIKQLLKKDPAKYILGFAAGVLVAFLLSFGFKSEEAVVHTSSSIDNTSQAENKEDFEQKYNKLNEEYKVLLGQLDNLKNSTQNYSNLTKLLEIDKLVLEQNYVAAADMLAALNAAELKGIEKAKYDSLRGQAMEKAAKEIFTQGRELYKKKQFKEALEKFDKVVLYVGEWKNSNATTYYRGVCYLELNNRDKALEAFKEVISKYPSSSFARYSQSRMNEMNS
ncbi:tetratricopeptide repeat protein [Acetivibrio cellulolyticus]|uniref:tetratricopeptide repeat protein n=1 Tax=Acetivibrio cellulolyticus TaxID=35830 RepID=UPI0001E30111|nr:tetratricopeptide repeat protein [Acetivibrio cellulolyticus]